MRVLFVTGQTINQYKSVNLSQTVPTRFNPPFIAYTVTPQEKGGRVNRPENPERHPGKRYGV